MSLEKKATEATAESLEGYIRELLAVAGKERQVSLEVIKGNADFMFKQGIFLYEKFNKDHENVVIKIPVSPYLQEGDYEGIKTVEALSKKEIKTNVTLVFTLNQALLAAEAGATYVSPFVGRIDDLLRKKAGLDISHEIKEGRTYFPSGGMYKEKIDGRIVIHDKLGIVSGIDLVAKMVHMYKLHGYKTKVLAASIRDARQVAEAAEAGADIATIPRSVLGTLLLSELTKVGMERFEKDCPDVYRKLLKA